MSEGYRGEPGATRTEENAQRSTWQLARLEIRTTLSPEQWPLARVELLHAERGRLTDIAWKEGPMECVFLAIRRLVGLDAKIKSLHLAYVPADEDSGGACMVTATVATVVDGSDFVGCHTCDDIIRSCAEAYLDALAQAEQERRQLDGGAHTPPGHALCMW